MITFRYYDKENRVDHAWYNSSNVAYSACEDKIDDFKTLTVTFNNGATYRYKNVNVHDYLMFMAGGLDGSNGKALNKFIKAKCECEKVGNMAPEQILALKEYYKKLKEEENNKSDASSEENEVKEEGKEDAGEEK